jgi:hypothetical protein
VAHAPRDKNIVCINTPAITFPREENLENILGRAKGLGIKFDEEEKKDLEQLSASQELLHDAECERANLDQEGEDTTVHDAIIDKLREEIKVLARKSR